MHIIRGSGLSGLAGMEYRRGRVIRPLLDIYRSEVEKYCSDNNLSPRIDSTNLTTDFTRNRIRHDLIPFIDRNFGSDFTESLCRLSAIAACDDNYLEAQASVAYAECLEYSGEDFVRLKMARLADLHPALLKRVLRLALQNASGNLKDIGSLHIEKLCRLVPNGGTGTVIQLPGGMRAGISYELLKIYKGREKSVRTVFDSPVSLPGHTVVDGKSAYIDASLEEMPKRVDKYEKIRYNSLVQYFDYDCLNKDIRIRNRREGDLFKPFKSTGTKKLKEFFIDGKIPREDRDGIPLLASGREIVWVIGYKISDKFKVTENTKRVLRMEYRRTYDGGN